MTYTSPRVAPGISGEADTVLGGTGLILASTPMEQDKVYFEVRVVEPGRMLIGASRGFAVGVTRWSDGDSDARLQETSVRQSALRWVDVVVLASDDSNCCALNQADLPTCLEFFVNGASFATGTLTCIDFKRLCRFCDVV
uniref:Uncharacterized protein n=1 Tax=Toxoplasma gondii COUG TaxID=1074873 RepID=A0A2G8Y5G5_TOXGO|nr:hypothetical protein TGCOUG_240260A [Toxoplasma gondii COUG]